ncbi:unnamed protein product [Sphagnum jensenii]|uniref:CHCH domain-containing protein n=1 Tax=Sphagnum jensenii TaxID=128206 RepID=A0ABP0WBJ5_9BRYO
MATAWCSPTAHPRTHKSSNKEEEEDDDDAAVQQLHDCAVLYKSLEDCLVNTDRNWKACQAEVKALKACYQAQAAQRQLLPQTKR